MISLLKTFGKGFLYVLGLPFFLVALALFGAIGLLAFVFQILKSVIFFFTGHKFFPELKEDQELRLLKEKANQQKEISESIREQPIDNSPSIITPIPEEELASEKPLEKETTPIIQQEPVNKEPTIEQAVFESNNPFNNLLKDEEETIDIELEEEPVIEQPVQQETLVETVKIDESVIEPAVEDNTLSTLLETKEEKVEDEEELVEQLETYVPKSSSYSATEDDDEDDDTDSGVNIDYNL